MDPYRIKSGSIALKQGMEENIHKPTSFKTSFWFCSTFVSSLFSFKIVISLFILLKIFPCLLSCAVFKLLLVEPKTQDPYWFENGLTWLELILRVKMNPES